MNEKEQLGDVNKSAGVRIALKDNELFPVPIMDLKENGSRVLLKAREGMVLLPSKSNPQIKRWQRIGEGRGAPAPKPFSGGGGGEKRQWIEHLEGLPENTKVHHTDEEGNFHEHRKNLHTEIHSKFLDHVPSVPEHKSPTAVVMMGGPAAGKGSLVSRVLKNQKDFVNVNPDDVREHLPEYKQAKAANARDAARITHAESSHIAGDIFKQGVAQRKNILVDGTGKDAQKHQKTIEALKAKGYNVHLLMPDISKETAFNRVESRAAKTGRSVPREIVEQAHTVIPGNFEHIANMADSAHLFDNEGSAPRPVWSIYNKGEKHVHHDKDYVSNFKKKAQSLHKGMVVMMKSNGGETGEKPPSIHINEVLRRIKQNKPDKEDEGHFAVESGFDEPERDDSHLDVDFD